MNKIRILGEEYELTEVIHKLYSNGYDDIAMKIGYRRLSVTEEAIIHSLMKKEKSEVCLDKEGESHD